MIGACLIHYGLFPPAQCAFHANEHSQVLLETKSPKEWMPAEDGWGLQEMIALPMLFLFSKEDSIIPSRLTLKAIEAVRKLPNRARALLEKFKEVAPSTFGKD